MKYDPSLRTQALAVTRVCLLLGLMGGLGCVSGDLRSMQEAETALEECIAEKSATHPDCEAARVTYLERQRRYEEISRTAWGCAPAADECPTLR